MSAFPQIQIQFPPCTFDIHHSNVGGGVGNRTALLGPLTEQLRWFGIFGWQNDNNKKNPYWTPCPFITRAWEVARQEFQSRFPSLAEPPWAGNPASPSLVLLLSKVEMCAVQASLGALTVKRLQAMQEMQVWSLGLGRPPGEGMASHSSIIAWRIPWMRSLVGHSLWGRKEL